VISLIIILPVIIAYLGSVFYPENILANYKIAIYNEDKTWLGQFGFIFLKQFFKWENAIEIKNEEALGTTIKSGDYDSIIIIPKGFMSDLKDYKPTKLNLIPNPQKIQDSLAVYTVFKALFKELAGIPDLESGSTLQFLMSGGIGVDTQRKAPDIEILVPNMKTGSIRSEIKADIGFEDIFAPSVAVIMIMIFCMIGVGNSIAHTKESGLFDIYRSNGLKVYQFINFKFIAYFVVGLVASLFSWYLYRLFGVNSMAGEIEIIFLIVVTSFSFTAFGILFSSFTKTSKSSGLLLTALTGCMMLFGDILIPIPQGSIIKSIVNFMPIKYSVDAWRKVSVLGYSLSEVSYEIFILLIFGVVSYLLSNIIMARVEKK